MTLYLKFLRANEIIELSKNLHNDFLEQNKNTVQEILIEKKSPKTNLYSATTKNYIKIYFKDDDNNLRHTLKTINLADFELN